jgi:Family of unknown function (DUF5636)
MEHQHLSQTKNAIASSDRESALAQRTEGIARSSTHPIVELQGAIGNRAVNQLLANQPPVQAKPMFRGLSHELVIQPKLTIGAVGDKYEQEADRISQQVVNQINTPEPRSSIQSSSVQRQEMPEENDELQMKPVVQRVANKDGGAIAPNLETSIQQARGNGQPLVDSVQQPKLNEHQITKHAISNNCIQRYVDVNVVNYINDEKFPEPDTSDEGQKWKNKKSDWIPKYKTIQEKLSDINFCKPHLDTINDFLLANPKLSLSNALAQLEIDSKKWSKSRPLLLGFVESKNFEDIVRRGQLFEDWVSKLHGSQTHRIQWYIIGKVYPNEVNQLYTGSVDPDWRSKTYQNMWDLVVDELQSKKNHDNDFTCPEVLEAYLNKTYSNDNSNRLKEEIQRYQEEFTSYKQALQARRPKSKTARAEEILEDSQGQQWTGWMSQQTEKRPTMLYPPGHDAEATAPGIEAPEGSRLRKLSFTTWLLKKLRYVR